MLKAIIDKYKLYPVFYKPLNFTKSNNPIKPILNSSKQLKEYKNNNECLNAPYCQADLCNKCFNNKE